MNEDAAGGLVELGPPTDMHMLRGPHHVQNVGRAGIQSHPPQDLGETQQVGQDVAAGVLAISVQRVEVSGHGRSAAPPAAP